MFTEFQVSIRALCSSSFACHLSLDSYYSTSNEFYLKTGACFDFFHKISVEFDNGYTFENHEVCLILERFFVILY